MSKIHDLVSTGDLEGIRTWLHDHPEDINARNEDGYTPLHLASREGHAEVVELLLAVPGVDVNAIDHLGRTTLHCCCLKRGLLCEYIKIIKLLLDHPNINLKNMDHSIMYGKEIKKLIDDKIKDRGLKDGE